MNPRSASGCRSAWSRGATFPRESLASLSDLLAYQRERSPRGILLTARTGAGKTLAAFKAFRDCFRPVRDLGGAVLPPPLAGCLPLRLPVTADVPVVREMRNDVADKRPREQVAQDHAPRLLRELMLHAARLPESGWEAVDHWVTHGPPLLLFADLNAADDLVRLSLAHALGQWQVQFGSDAQHRVVATYRAGRVDDDVLTTLRRLGPFDLCDLRPIDDGQAENYLAGYRDLKSPVLRGSLAHRPARANDLGR